MIKRILLAALALAVLFIPVTGSQAFLVSPYLVLNIIDARGTSLTVIATNVDPWIQTGPSVWEVEALAIFPNGDIALAYVYIDLNFEDIYVFVDFFNGTWYEYWNDFDGFLFHYFDPYYGIHYVLDRGFRDSSFGFIPSAAFSIFLVA